jgi:hypothetical protein
MSISRRGAVDYLLLSRAHLLLGLFGLPVLPPGGGGEHLPVL